MSKKEPVGHVSTNCRSQFLANAKEIYKLLAAGHKKKAIHRYLVTHGHMSMSYQAFLTILKDPDNTRPFSKKTSPTKKAEANNQSASNSSRTFKHPNTPYHDTDEKGENHTPEKPFINSRKKKEDN